MKRTLIAVTMGDPAGIGAEVALKALDRRPKSSTTRFLLLGSWRVWAETAKRLRTRTPLVMLPDPETARGLKGGVGVLELGGPRTFHMGKVDPSCGAAAVSYIREGVRLAFQGRVSALVTAPIHKDAVHRAGYLYPGHTEMLADWSHTRSYAMMMVGGPFRITLASIHVSLRQAVKEVTLPNLLEKLSLTHRCLRDWFKVRNPRIAVAGLNPHAGENGAFGDEEKRVVAPAVRRARAKGWNVTGPYPPDTLFHRAAQGEFDAVLAMYHDQGLIPLKLAAFEKGVNLTLGLPFIRTSPDHGTAFDLAGKGKADPSSMSEAIALAVKLSNG